MTHDLILTTFNRWFQKAIMNAGEKNKEGKNHGWTIEYHRLS
jgi:hypothetical protein